MSILRSIYLEENQEIKRSDLARQLSEAHYELTNKVNTFGQFSLMGDRLILFPINHNAPILIDFFGETIEQLKFLSKEASKLRQIPNITVMPNYVDDDGVRFEPGQFIVHLDHGIGRFKTLGMRGWQEESFILKGNEEWKPYLIIEYAQGAELFVPPDQVKKITHYIGSRSPVLSKLGSQRWQTIKKRVEESIFKLARELLLIAAKREIRPRPKYKIQQEWLNKVSADFIYDETDDQQKAIEACLSDLQTNKPMDRLICGDVGFGKTEVAIRAAVAVASTGKQVAILAPTTLLVRQHLATLQERLKGLPIKIAALSRFVSESERQKIINDLNNGLVDIVVGTHGLLQPGIHFKDLGLLVIDEEQRFGVKHKEHFKKLRAQVDILTLSATPIPRTLFSGLSGLRDISLIVTPPKKRLPIKTIIEKSNNNEIVKAVKFEVDRGGQVFILHNDVASIEARARYLRDLLPGVKLEVAHGQLPEDKLARVMESMIHQQIDVLLTSTIIESGLDMPNVNTLIVEKADRFGLADLYQLRGRVGRSDRQAFAYFFYDVSELTKTSALRFKALAESERLGSGYSVALQDLEIRGGGNVLGREQHGNMEAIGLSLYTKMLKLTIEKMKHKKSTDQ